MRLFFALEIDPDTQHAMHDWCRQTLPGFGRQVPVANLHLTLNFLGEVSPDRIERLCLDVDRIEANPFSLVLDQPGFFPRPGIFWLGPASVPAALSRLVRQLAKVARRQGIREERRPFEPHVTLLRKCSDRPPLPATVPGFSIDACGFSLFQSIAVPGGVRYRSLQRWEA